MAWIKTRIDDGSIKGSDRRNSKWIPWLNSVEVSRVNLAWIRPFLQFKICNNYKIFIRFSAQGSCEEFGEKLDGIIRS